MSVSVCLCVGVCDTYQVHDINLYSMQKKKNLYIQSKQIKGCVKLTTLCNTAKSS